MVAIIDVADTHANIGRERKVLGQVQLDASHVDSLTPGWLSVKVIDRIQCIVKLILIVPNSAIQGGMPCKS
jgi:hypothetical protein